MYQLMVNVKKIWDSILKSLNSTTRCFLFISLLINFGLYGILAIAGSYDYDIPNYGGPWATLHRDNRNSNYAPVLIADKYSAVYQTVLYQTNYVRPVVGPEGNVYFSFLGYPPGGGQYNGYLVGYQDITGKVKVLLKPPSVDKGVVSSNVLIDTNGDLYLPCQKFISKFTSTGQILWKTKIKGNPSSGAQFTPDGKIIFFSWNGWVYVINPVNGNILLEKNLTPNRNYPSNPPGSCLAKGDSQECAFANTSSVNPFTNFIYQTYIEENGFSSVRAYAYSSLPYDIKLLWSNNILEGGSASSIVISSDYQRLYVSDRASHVIALNALTGEKIWQVGIGYTAECAATVSPSGYIFPCPSGSDNNSHFVIIRDAGDHGEIVFENFDYQPLSSSAAGLLDRFVVVGRKKNNNQVELLVIDPHNGIISRNPWVGYQPNKATGISLNNDGWIFVNAIEKVGLKAFRPINYGPMQ